MATNRVVIAVHGGAGGSCPEQRQGLHDALLSGVSILRDGGLALDAVCAAVALLEDDPWFNAGRGAVRTAEGLIELDAAVMDGANKRVGCVAGISRARNPVAVARLLLDRGGPVFLAGAGADHFAVEHGADIAAPDWFALPAVTSSHGTVGAVARDAQGNLAAATSTGGVSGQPRGRVGDTPIIGAGTYADTACAISATGDGEAFIRGGFAHHVAARVGEGWSLSDACDDALAAVAHLGGTGGCVAMTSTGSVSAPFNTSAMPRGWATMFGDVEIEL